MLRDLTTYREALEKRFGKTNARYLHSLSVADVSKTLAKRFGVSEQEAYLAGLLHDWEKNKPLPEVIKKAKQLGIDKRYPAPALHGPLAAKTLKAIFPELSEEVLSAIKKHTVADADMSDLDKIVFLADAIEPLRKDTPEIQHVRKRATSVSLDELYQEAFIASLIYVLQKKQPVSSESIELYNQLVQHRA